MNNLMVFENKQVEVFEINGQVLFNPYHCGKCLDISPEGVRKAITRMNSNQVIKLKNSDVTDSNIRKLNNAGENFLTESGVYKLIFKSKKKEAEKFQDWVTDEVLPQIRQTGGYIPINQEESEQDILAKALLIAQNTLKKKDELLKAKEIELESKDRFINQLAASENSLLVREVAKVASKQNIVIGEKRLWTKLREWGLIFLKSTEPKQIAIDKGLFEVNEGTKEAKGKVFTYRTTRVTGKGQAYIIDRLLKEL
ncbi:MAG: phage antirepressor KilAC domain-containing protein [Clostridium sp.]|uniref:phage antirepressor KilAC domain-containing protein n=1 Tax=Clostridium sp. TaxID=1506 RepID=UPI002A74AE68|nr:phage antirepressor KilAC domain-containing protein [Clostridium sp.]MDY2632407.1 phage antirepressor KilAC domain-containing protein [Clostridium sp.]